MMNTKNREVTIDDHFIVLTKVEYDLLKMFMEHQQYVYLHHIEIPI